MIVKYGKIARKLTKNMLRIFKKLLHPKSKKTRSKLDTGVVQWVDEVAIKVQESIWNTWENIPRPATIIQDCDIDIAGNRWIQDYLLYISQKFTKGFVANNDLQDYLKTNGNFAYLESAIEILIRDAFLDIYALQILWIQYWVNEWSLKRILFENMQYGNSPWVKWISYLIRSHTHPSEGFLDININEMIELLKNNRWNWWTDSPACPFSASTLKKEWVEEIWKYISKVIIPKFQKEYWYSTRWYEVFWSWGTKKDSSN